MIAAIRMLIFSQASAGKAFQTREALRMQAKKPGKTWLFSLAPPVGLEPTTLRLTAACSTD